MTPAPDDKHEPNVLYVSPETDELLRKQLRALNTAIALSQTGDANQRPLLQMTSSLPEIHLKDYAAIC